MLTNNQMGQPQKPTAAESQIFSLKHLLQSFREEEDVNALVKTTITYLQEQFDYPLIWIALYDRLNHILFGKGGITPSSDKSFLRQRLVLSPGDLLEQVVIEQIPLDVPDLREEVRATEWQDIANRCQIQGTAILPISYKDRCLGLVLLGSGRWGYVLSEASKALLQIVFGELAVVLYQNEMDLQHKQTKRPDKPLIQLLENLCTLNNLDQKLKLAVEATHQFVSPSRTNIYWFERQGRYFWCRMSNRLINLGRDSHPQQEAAGMTVQELNDFYYALAVNQIVWIGDARSSLKSHFTGKLLQRLGVRSLLAAPIIWQKDLLGFLAVESLEPKIWTEADKNFVQGAAGLISLIAPTENAENTIRQIQQDSQLTSQVAQAIYDEHDLNEALHICATRVLERLTATRFLLLQYDPENNNYQILYQNSRPNRRPWTFTLSPLREIDWRLLQKANQVIEIENFDEDLRFISWRTPLLENGVRSLLVCNCAQDHAPAVILVITHETHHSWNTLDKELLWVVNQQIGVSIRQWQVQGINKNQERICQTFEECLNMFVDTHRSTDETDYQKIKCTALERIASILDCPLALLISWNSGQPLLKITPIVSANHRFGTFADIPVSHQSDPLIQLALSQNGYLNLRVSDLSLETRKWLIVPDNSQILLIALRHSADDQPESMFLLADQGDRPWPELSINATVTLTYQLAWWYHQKQVTQNLELTTEKLRQLNWYKNRRLEEIHRTTTLLLSQITDLGIPSNELTQTRYQLLLRQLDHTTASMTGLLKLEQWQLHISWETMPIVSLLKRSLERVENILKQRKLWVSVHGLGQPIEDRESPKSSSSFRGVPTSGNQSAMTITGDIVKIELILHECLVAACYRSQEGGRIDLWCRRLDERSLELSITDNGAIEPQLLTEFYQNTAQDVLNIGNLDHPPGLHLYICQNIMQQLGGELYLYQLPDHRVVSRLLLPLANKNI